MVLFFSKRWKVVQGPTTDRTSDAKHITKRNAETAASSRDSWWRWRLRRFSAIGWGYVLLMVLIFSLSSAWSLLLIILNLEPSKSANYILQTESLDNGHFWQSRKAASSVQVATTSILLVVVGVYWFLLYLLLVKPRSSRIHSEQPKPKQRKLALRRIPTVEKIVEKQKKIMRRPLLLTVRRILGAAAVIYRSVVSTDGKYRKVWNVLMEIPEVILQILSLREYMSQGIDPSLLYCYASLMALNAFVAFYDIQFRWSEATIHHILKDSIVDAAFAVFFPALILFYSLFVFQDDLKAVKIRQRFFPPRIFERKARNYVSPKELNMFNTDFESLLIRSAWDVFLKLSFSLLACFRWGKITMLLLEKEHKGASRSHSSVSKAGPSTTVKPSKNCKGVVPTECPARRGIDSSKAHSHYLRRRVRKTVGMLFLIYAVGCIVYTPIAVHISQSSCSSYPQCVQFGFLWTPGTSKVVCKCLAYVDRDLAPADSDNLTDVTQTLTELAAAGQLTTVQLVNRKINGSLPEELQTCHGLRSLVLIHTGVEVFPSWTSTSFTKMEYLHIEGDTSDTNLVELPSDLFASMTSLHTIHLSYHSSLSTLPDLVGLQTLECVYFGYLDDVKEIPSTSDLPALQVIALEGLPFVRSLPDVAQYESTLEMVFVQDVPACCSGFLSEGDCNTTFPSCCGSDDSHDDSRNGSGHDALPRTCLDLPDDESLLPSNATLTILSQFATNVSNFCDAAQATCPTASLASKHKDDDICRGILYRECSSESEGPGICFNENMGRVECTYSQATIDMRKEEIAAGCSCDKVEEQWLGCT